MNKSAWYYAGAGALILILVAELALSAGQNSQTIDEGVHLLSGYQYWRHGDFGANPEHPPLVKWVAAWPLTYLELKDPGVVVGPTKASHNAAYPDFLYRNTADPDVMLYRARMAVVLFPVLLGILVFLWANEMFGLRAAFLSLLLFVCEPNILANGALVTTDLGETCFFFASVYTFYRLMQFPAISRALLCGCALALALGAKHSGVLLCAVLLLLTGSEVLKRKGMSRLKELAPSFGIMIVVAWVGLWSFYLFRYAARPDGVALNPPTEAFMGTLQSGIARTVLLAVNHAHLLPESYLWGLTDVLIATEGRATFLLGTVYATGQWFYFPLVFLMKSTLGVLLLLLIFPYVAMRWMGRREIVFLAVPVLVFLAVSINSGLNIGLRHILPIIPFVILMAGSAANWIAKQSRGAAVVVMLLLLGHVASSLRVFPDYLTYANEAFGGSARSRKLMTDSNVDWSQGFKQAADYVSEHQIKDCWVANRLPPDRLRMPCKALPSGLTFRRGATPMFPREIEGTVFISANETAGQAWGPGEMNPYHQFFVKDPDEVIANSVLVFRGKFDVSLASALNHAGMAQRNLAQEELEKAWNEATLAAGIYADSAEVQATLCQVGRATKRTEALSACDAAITIANKTSPEYQFERVPIMRALAGAR